MKVLLGDMSWVEARDYLGGNDVVFLPVGSNEQHGPHNPLGTDFLIAEAIGKEAAKRLAVVCLPVVPFGVSSHHRQLWGTVFVSFDVFKSYVRDVCLSLAYYGVRKIVIVNGHGGNLNALIDLARELRERNGLFLFVFQWWHASPALQPDLFSVDERKHASAEETSLNLFLHSDLVDLSKVVDERVFLSPLRGDGFYFSEDTVDFSKSGVWGKASGASTEKGKLVFEAVVKYLVDRVEVLRKVDVEDLMPKAKL